jgi:hypothetical protein
MIDNYYWDHKRILNENDSQAISSSQFIVNRKSHKRSTFSMFQNAFIGNIAINIYEVEILLFDNSVLKITYKVI